ncbi:cyclin-dependent kinase 2-interacting protein-like [Anthonomus grandis grandis]|uniref:cyclin-dependent kinase 2-interacting protein-like n=1 Tax=Anthonomus grandis grandis TaxID=2921223 RepID=UPI002165279B|nr:cyclin-dependent kinase 2-interacting protein-like [Anthonomus grandis grandis]
MSKKTPKRPSLDLNLNTGFSSVTLHKSPAAQSPQKNLTGPPRVIRDIIADLYNNIQRWNSLHIKGCSIVKEIASVKADTPKTYSTRLEECITSLYAVVEGLKINNDVFSKLVTQVYAFGRLPNIDDTVFFSLSASNIAERCVEVCEAYKKEFQAKQYILENIAYTRTTNDVMFLAAYWTHQLNITDKVNFVLKSLLVESGHRPVQ